MTRYITLFLVFMFILTSGVNAQKNDKSSKLEEVIVVFKTHFDIGYTDWAANVKYNYSNSMMEGALKGIEKSKQMPGNQQFKWIVAG